MAFNPDAYLAEKEGGFDPDAYLAQKEAFDPDAYLAEKGAVTEPDYASIYGGPSGEELTQIGQEALATEEGWAPALQKTVTQMIPQTVGQGVQMVGGSLTPLVGGIEGIIHPFTEEGRHEAANAIAQMKGEPLPYPEIQPKTFDEFNAQDWRQFTTDVGAQAAMAAPIGWGLRSVLRPRPRPNFSVEQAEFPFVEELGPAPKFEQPGELGQSPPWTYRPRPEPAEPTLLEQPREPFAPDIREVTEWHQNLVNRSQDIQFQLDLMRKAGLRPPGATVDPLLAEQADINAQLARGFPEPEPLMLEVPPEPTSPSPYRVGVEGETARFRPEMEMAETPEGQFEFWKPGQEPVAPERIGQAAIKVGDDVFTGPTHAHAYEQAGLPAKQAPGTVTSGFMTEGGKFVTEEQGAALARQAGQIKRERGGRVSAEDIQMEEPIQIPTGKGGGKGPLGAGSFDKVMGEQDALTQRANAAEARAPGSPEAQAAWNEVTDHWDKVVKPMKAIWGRLGVEQQGPFHYEQGSFVNLRKAAMLEKGKDITPEQVPAFREVSRQLRESLKLENEAIAKVDEAMRVAHKNPRIIKDAGELRDSLAKTMHEHTVKPCIT